MSRQRIAVFFPGQGAFYGGVLKESYTKYPQIKAVFTDIDAVVKERCDFSVADAVFNADSPGIHELLAQAPEALPFAIYGTSVATYKILESHGLRPTVLMGHSLGEIAAMVCAGAFSVSEGAEIVLHRNAALQELEDCNGYMAALGTDPAQATKLLELTGKDQVAIAAENHDSQTVISGCQKAMDLIEMLATILQIPFFRLHSSYPFHSPLMQPAVAKFADKIRHLAARPLQVPVFSPILGRYYNDHDVLDECLAEHLVNRVRFSDAVRRIYDEGIRIYVESGALDTLGKLAKQGLRQPDLITLACLDPKLGDSASLANAIYILGSHGLLPHVNGNGVAHLLLPGVGPDDFHAFWTASESRILYYVKTEYEAFKKTRPVSAPQEVSVQDGAGPATDRPAVSPAPASRSRDVLFKELAGLYAAALEYPEEVFTEDVQFEAELGIDSVKQTELLARVGELYNLPPRPADFRLSDYLTMGNITDFVFASLTQATPTAPQTVPQPRYAAAGRDARAVSA